MKRVWILNHYAGTPDNSIGLRHYNFAKKLIARGYDVTVFAASTLHGTDRNLITDNRPYVKDDSSGVPFVYIKARDYSGNGKARVLNMLDYYFGVKKCVKDFPKPDIIYASSVHPLTVLAGTDLKKRYHCRLVSEFRDLWPESLLDFGGMSPKSPIVIALYKLEHYLYKKADALIFTQQGGADYIANKGYKGVDPEKIYYINNGVDLKTFNKNCDENAYYDSDLDDEKTFKVVYAGTVRKANNLGSLIKAAEKLKDCEAIKFLIFGIGEDRESLEAFCIENGINNVIFKGSVKKSTVPYVLSKSNLNILNYHKASIWRYGGSQNKLFEYLASGKPVCANVKIAYSPIDEYGCGVSENLDTPEEFAAAIRSIYELPQAEYEKMCENARRAACEFDFEKLTDRLVKALEAE